ncbi:SRPBCC family protein [Flexivirga alba]|uniref:SRPBCC family protein n=1 Tax=Flexivirga alba TaxID=702742 RepID=A0ABW2AAT9_9MICO
MAAAHPVPTLEDSVEIEASPEEVWEVIKDVRRLAEWSPQVESTLLKGDLALGVRFTNANRHGELTWRTHGQVVTFEPGNEMAFRIEENWVVWSFRLEKTDRDTVILTQRRDAPDGISDLSKSLTDTYLGGQEPFTAVMREGMRVTLQGIRETVLSGVRK